MGVREVSQKVVVLGAWHLGSVTGACIADAGNSVAFWDASPLVSEKLKTGRPPLFEPGLEELFQKHWGHQIRWIDTDQSPHALSQELAQANWIVLAHDTPVDEQDRLQPQVVESAFERVLESPLKTDATLFITAQLPAGTSARWRERLSHAQPKWQGRFLYMPENLRLGDALKCFRQPDRAVVGVDTEDQALRDQVIARFRLLTGLKDTHLDVMSLQSAEMVKHALNAFLGMSVVFANEIADHCERLGANAWDVLASLKRDARVGPKAFLRPGLGFAGGTIGRDLRTLEGWEHSQKREPGFFSTVYARNQARNQWIADTMTQRYGELRGMKVALLGVTYKVNTSTVRRSPAIEIGQLLQALGAQVTAFDPQADFNELSAQERQALPFRIAPDAASAMRNSDATVLVTEWPQFAELPWQELAKDCKPLILDTKNALAVTEKAGWERILPGEPHP